MDSLQNTSNQQEKEFNFSFKTFFFPFTTFKAIHWIVMIGIIVYFNVLFNGFVWDDFTYMIANPAIHVFNLFSLFGVNNQFNGPGYYRPIPAVYISLLWNMFGTMAFFYHAIQIMLQIACSCLVFFFFKRFFSVSLSFFLSLVFLLHPIQTESVAYISGAQNNLFFFFGMIAFLISTKENQHKKQFLLMSLFLLISLLSKETGFLFLLMILLYQFFYKREYFAAITGYFIATITLYLLIRFSYAQDFLTKNSTIPIALLSFSERLINIPAIIFYYLQTFFYPAQLSIDQQWIVTSLSFSDFYLPLFGDILFLIFLLVFGVYIFKKKRKLLNLYLFFVIWFFLGIGLVIQIFPLDATVSDRWFYFPIVGILGILGILFQTLQTKKKITRNLIVGIAFVSISLLSIRTMVRNTNYVDQLTLFSHDAAISRNGFDLENQLGAMYYQANNIAESRKHFQRAVAEMPCLNSTSNLMIVDQQIGDAQAVTKDKMILAKCARKTKLY